MSGRTDRGFTLVEVLIAIVVAGVLGASLMGLVLGQQRFYGHSDDAILAQQNTRAALDLMAAELRMASPTDLIVAQTDSVSVRFDILRGVSCDTLTADQAIVFVYDSVGSANLPAGFRGTAYSGAYDSTWVYADGFTPSVNSTGGTNATYCQARGAPASPPASSFRQTSGWTGSFASGPPRGATIRWYGRLDYWFGPSTSTSGEAIWRNNQELVTPFEAGARFQYVMDDGSVQSSVAAGQLANVRQIRVQVAALGDGSNRWGVRRPITYDIPLRN